MRKNQNLGSLAGTVLMASEGEMPPVPVSKGGGPGGERSASLRLAAFAGVPHDNISLRLSSGGAISMLV